MAGHVKRKERERLEAEAAQRRAARASPTKRRAAVARAEQVGDELAAREFSVKRATIRSWRRVVKQEGPEPAPAAVESAAHAETQANNPARPISGLEGMRKARDSARAVEAQAVEQTQTLLAAGQAREAQAASVAGGVWSDKALALDKAIDAAEREREAEAVRLNEATVALQAAVLRGTFDAVDLPLPTSTMRTLAEQASRGEPLHVPAETAVAERERVRAKVRAEHLEELIAEGWSQARDDAHDDALADSDDGAAEAELGNDAAAGPAATPERASEEEIRAAIERGQGYGSPYGDLAKRNSLSEFRNPRVGGL